MSRAGAAEAPAGVCPRCTGAGYAHYLTCPTLRFPQPAPPRPPAPSRDAVPQRPSPGSYEAAAQGCCCPVHENNHGNLPPDGWQIPEGCPVHAPAEDVA